MSRATIVQLLAMAAAAGLLFYFGHAIAAAVLGAMACLVIVLALLAPGPLRTLQEALERLVRWLANGLGVLLLSLVYISVFVAGSLWLRLRRADPLNRGFPGAGKTNWIDRVGYGTDKALYHKLYSRPHAEPGSREVTQ